ncbi:MAG TPA: hypothetical protein VIO58_08510 [Candidatus Methanoperedens sp.]
MSSKNHILEIEERMARKWRESVAENAGDNKQIVELKQRAMVSDSLAGC